jgi:putative transposase
LGYPTKNTFIGWYREYLANQDLRSDMADQGESTRIEQKHSRRLQHYLDKGRCMAFTLRELGYPSREVRSPTGLMNFTLRHVRMVGSAPNVQHPTDVKKAAVIELCTRTTSAEAIAQKVRYAGRRCTTGRINYSAQRRPHP